MSLKLLPDSRITSMVMGNNVFAYAQTYDGDIYQFVGNVENSSAYSGSRRKSNVIIERLKGSNPTPTAPKLFSPIAAVSYNERLNTPMSEKVGNLRHLYAISQADQRLVGLLSR
jgi:hypothetical protein